MAVLQSIHEVAGAIPTFEIAGVANILGDILQAFVNPQVTIQSIGDDASAVALNVVETENLTFGLTITDKPVETRTKILDHITKEPIEIRLDVLISNIDTNPLNLKTIAAFAGSIIPNLAGLVATGGEVLAAAGLFDTGDEEIKAKIGQLVEWQTDGEIVSLVGLKVDPNLVTVAGVEFILGNLEFTNSKELGDGVGFSIDVKQVLQAIVEPFSLRGLIEAELRDDTFSTIAIDSISGIVA